MKTPNHRNCRNERTTNAAAEADVIDSFRGWLQTAITAWEYGQNGGPSKQPGSKTPELLSVRSPICRTTPWPGNWPRPSWPCST